MDPIRTACWREEGRHVGYADKDKTLSNRVILPSAVIYTDRTQTVLPWYCLRKDFCMFRAHRLRDWNELPAASGRTPACYLSELERERSRVADVR